MTVGFARLGKGETVDISFPYDEVLIMAKGAYTVRAEQDDVLTARAGVHQATEPASSTN